jgi:ADP-heptose:LPS heptosyltransferase
MRNDFVDPKKPSRILCIRLSAVGDVSNTLPALEALRRGRPDALIGPVVEDRAHDLITNHPSVDRVHLYRRKRWSRWLRQPIHWPKLYEEFSAFLWEIRREKYEVALNFQSRPAASSVRSFWPSRRLHMPARSSALMWTKAYLPPASLVMKP